MKDFLTVDSAQAREFEEKSQAIEQLKETQAALEKFSNLSNLVDRSHLPSA